MSKQFLDFTEITSLAGNEYVPLQRDSGDNPNLRIDAQTFSGVEKNRIVGVNEQGGASYTLQLTDVGKLINMTSGSANTVYVPLNSAVAFPLYTVIHVTQTGVGQTTLAETLGVTFLYTDTLNLRAANSWVSVVQLSTDVWIVTGDVELL